MPKNVSSESRERDFRKALAAKMVADLPDPAPVEDPDKQAAVQAEDNLAQEVQQVLDAARLGQVPELPEDNGNDEARLSRFVAALQTDLPRHQKQNLLGYSQRLLRRMARLHQI